MKKLSKTMLMALAIILFLSACQPKEQKIYIVSTNDMHANIDNFPQMAGLIDSLRSVHPDLLLFGAGDNRSGNPIRLAQRAHLGQVPLRVRQCHLRRHTPDAQCVSLQDF